MTILLSKVDIDLTQGNLQDQNTLDLFLGDATTVPTVSYNEQININESICSGTVETFQHQLICYHLSKDCQTISLYQLNDVNSSRSINIHLTKKLMNKQHTLTFSIDNDKNQLFINMILEDGIYVVINLNLAIFTNIETTVEDWFTAYAPYDFTIRVPNLLHTIDRNFSLVFLHDGGLIGFKILDDTKSMEPILFNDNSYLKSIMGMFKFSRNNKNSDNETHGKIISCKIYQDKYLITLTENCFIKIWDLNTFNMIYQYNLFTEDIASEKRSFDMTGNYLSIFHNYLVIYTPFDNGILQLGTLLLNPSGILELKIVNRIPTHLSASSIWFLSDMKLIKPIDLNLESSFLNILVLWKSGNISKLQILNIKTDDLQECEWVETMGKSINDLTTDFDMIISNNIIGDNDFEKILFNLKSRYSPEIFNRGQSILSENNIMIIQDSNNSNEAMKQNLEYLGNLQTILKDLKNKSDEVSSLSILNNEIVVVNTLKKYNHSIFKVNSSLENYYYNINSENSLIDDQLMEFLQSFNSFTSSLSLELINSCTDKFIDIITGEIPKDLKILDKFAQVFQTTLQEQFDIVELQKLFHKLNNMDVLDCLNNFIDNHLNHRNIPQKFTEAIVTQQLTTNMVLEGLFQKISIGNKFALDILLAFVLLDTDYSIFESQLTRLLTIFYKQTMFLKLYQQNKLNLVDQIFQETTKLQHGIKIYSYNNWDNYMNFIINEFYSYQLDDNPYLWDFVEKYIINYHQCGKDEISAFHNNIWSKFYLRDNKVNELLEAMILFICEDYNKSYEMFSLHDDYVDIPLNELPTSINKIINSEPNENSNIWIPILQTFKSSDYKFARFNYYLSCLFQKYGNSPDLGLKFIKKSIELSMLQKDNKPFDIVTLQHKQLLNLLIQFNIFDETLDILRLSHFCLNAEDRSSYFNQLLLKPNLNEQFFAHLLNSCQSHGEGDKYLSTSDYSIIDNILLKNISSGEWKDFKRLYSYRLLNGFKRESIEIIYQYLIHYVPINDLSTIEKCYLMIMNILHTFDTKYEQWFLNDDQVVTLVDLKQSFEKIIN